MRWDKLGEGALLSGIVAAGTAAIPFFADGKVTGAEGVMALGFFIGGAVLYIKQHPPVEWDGVERRQDPRVKQAGQAQPAQPQAVHDESEP